MLAKSLSRPLPTVSGLIQRRSLTVTLKNGIVAAWHEEKPFPYEHSRPIDQIDVENQREALRNADGYRKQAERIFSQDGPRDSTLRNMLYTGKTEFKTRTREDKLYATAAPVPNRRTKSEESS